MENRCRAYGADDIVRDSPGDGIKDDGIAEVFSSDLSSMAMLLAPSGSPDDQDVALGSVSGTKRLEHAPPSEPMHLPGLGMVDSIKKASGCFYKESRRRSRSISRTIISRHCHTSDIQATHEFV